jgi:two-component system, NarL family, sensor histidine kinase UhpB
MIDIPLPPGHLVEARFRRMVDMLPDAIWITQGDKIAFVNPAGLRLLGAATADQIIGKSPLHFIHPDYHALVRERMRRALETNEVQPLIEQRIVRLNGEIRDVEVAGASFPDEREPSILVVLRDITERKKGEARLLDALSLSKAATEAAHMGTWRFDPVTGRLDGSDEFLALAGVDRSQWRGMGEDLEPLVHPDDREHRRQVRANAIQTNSFMDLQFRTRTPDGEIRWMHSRGEWVRPAEGASPYFYGITMDITARKRDEESNKERDARYRHLVEHASDIIYESDPNGHFRFFNTRAAFEILKYSEAELMGQYYLDMVRPDWRERVDRFYRTQFYQRIPRTYLEFPVLNKDGEEVWFGQHVQQIVKNGRIVGHQAVCRDITALKSRETELERSQAKLRDLTAHLEQVREEERKRIAREIHDELGGLLTAIQANVSVAIDRAERAGKPVDRELVQASELASTASDKARRVIADLRPSVLDQLGLWTALEWYLGEIGQSAGFEYQSSIDTVVAALELDAERSTALFRIVQEALTNVVRHAHAKHVTLTITREANSLRVELADDGKGMAPDALMKTDSWGIVGMRERVSYFGGDLNITSDPECGTQVILHLPVENLHAQ